MNPRGLHKIIYTLTASLPRFFKKNESSMQIQDFADYLCSLCEEKGLVHEHVIKRADLDRTYGHQIFRGIRKPSRDKVIQLAFGFPLSFDETQQLLKIAEKSPLYPRIKRDAAIIFCLNRSKSLLETQLLLHNLGLSELGEE